MHTMQSSMVSMVVQGLGGDDWSELAPQHRQWLQSEWMATRGVEEAVLSEGGACGRVQPASLSCCAGLRARPRRRRPGFAVTGVEAEGGGTC